MSKKQTTHTRKFLRSDARRLSSEAIEKIRNAQNNISDAQHIMCKKHHIGLTTYQKIIDNQRPPEPTEEWCRIIESVSISDQILLTGHEKNNQVSLSAPAGPDNVLEFLLLTRRVISGVQRFTRPLCESSCLVPASISAGNENPGKKPVFCLYFATNSIKCAFMDVRARGVLLLRAQLRPIHARR